MFIVRGAKNKDGMRKEDFIKDALGTIDSDGNPFEIIELVWTGYPNQRVAEYTKTRGFENTQIYVSNNPNKPGMVVKHVNRGTGCIMWTRSLNGRGPFAGRLAKTAYNMAKLAKHYEDGLWRIKDRVLDAEVKAMSKKLWESMTDKQRKYNQARIKAANTLKSEQGLNLNQAPKPKVDQAEVDEKLKSIFEREQALKAKEESLAVREQSLKEKVTQKIESGEVPLNFKTDYTVEDLLNMNFQELKKLAKTKFEIPLGPRDNRKIIVEKIMAIIAPAPDAPVEEEVETVRG
jgi:hypothetical protein